MMTTTIQPRVYVACLAAYNNGILHGRWIDADDGEDAIWAEIREMLAESPIPGAEEWAIHDHEYLGNISEYESIERVAMIGAAVAGHGEPFLAFIDSQGRDDWTDASDFEERYRGEWESERAYAYHQVEELGLGGVSPGKYVAKDDYLGRSEIDVLEALNGYINWDVVVREIEMDTTFVRYNGSLYVFSSY